MKIPNIYVQLFLSYLIYLTIGAYQILRYILFCKIALQVFKLLMSILKMKQCLSSKIIGKYSWYLWWVYDLHFWGLSNTDVVQSRKAYFRTHENFYHSVCILFEREHYTFNNHFLRIRLLYKCLSLYEGALNMHNWTINCKYTS